jgi:hypothetical protein
LSHHRTDLRSQHGHKHKSDLGFSWRINWWNSCLGIGTRSNCSILVFGSETLMYLNVIPPPPAPLPSVRGLGQFRLVPPPGLGQAASSCAAYLQQQFNALPSAAEAAMLLNTPSPSGEVLSALYINGATSPQAAAQVVYQLAQEFCGQQGFTTVFGGTPPADCSDNGQAAAAAAYPQWLAYYQSLPGSVWTTGTVSAQVANPLAFIGQPGPTPLPSPSVSSNVPAAAGGGTSPTPPIQTPASSTPAAIAPTVSPAIPVAPTAQPAMPAASSASNWFSSDVSIGGFNVPVWGLIAAGIGILFIIPRGR